jgi:hypothetical protein
VEAAWVVTGGFALFSAALLVWGLVDLRRARRQAKRAWQDAAEQERGFDEWWKLQEGILGHEVVRRVRQSVHGLPCGSRD